MVFGVLISCDLLAGCATAPPISSLTPQDVKQKCAVNRDDFRKITTIEGMPLVWGDFGMNRFWLVAIRADTNNEVACCLDYKTTRYSYQGWAFWNSAVDHDGNNLPVLKLGSDVGDGGITYELVAVTLKRDYLESHADTGVDIRIDGQRDQHVVNLPPNYIRGFLSKVDETFK